MRYCLVGKIAVCCVLTMQVNILAAAETLLASEGETRFLDELYQVELLPRLQPGETCKMFSSYDRTGGNDDGFSGKYSILRKEEENGQTVSVLAEMEGPGCIQRMFFPYAGGKGPGVLDRKGEHVRIYLDGNKTPALDVPLEDIFFGKLEGFPKPVADGAIGAFYCYVPIPYKKSCKVVVDGTKVKFVHIVYRTFPNDNNIVPFCNPPTEPQRQSLAKVVKAWTECGDLATLGVDESNKVEKTFSLKAGESLDWALPEGPQMVRALRLKLNPEQIENAESARLQITWDDAKSPAVDLPLDYFFCQAKKPIEFRSLLVGVNDQGWYNFMPMPYQKSGKLILKAEKPLEGTLSLVTTAIGDKPEELGYLHVAYNESLPTEKGVFHPYLNREGRGRVVGVYLATDGDGRKKAKLPLWLEGDEWFTCDGELRIHGTGTEDGFNAGWYAVQGRLDQPDTKPLSGFPVYRKVGDRNEAVAFRWYLSDPVSYEKSIEGKLEHGPTNDVNANYRTAVFFYDAAP